MEQELGGYERALFDEVARKAGVLWLRHAGRTYVLWHAMVDGLVCVVGNGEEQPLPDVDDGDTVELVLRTKTDRQRVLEVTAAVERITPRHPDWEPITAALIAGRLNLVDREIARGWWAADSLVLRLHPRDVVAVGGSLPGESLAEPPLETPATTVSTEPWIVHRRQSQRPPLS